MAAFTVRQGKRYRATITLGMPRAHSRQRHRCAETAGRRIFRCDRIGHRRPARGRGAVGRTGHDRRDACPGHRGDRSLKWTSARSHRETAPLTLRARACAGAALQRHSSERMAPTDVVLRSRGLVHGRPRQCRKAIHSTRSVANENSFDWSRRERGAREREAMAVAQTPGGTEPPGKMQAPGREQPKAAESQHEKSQPKSSQTQPRKASRRRPSVNPRKASRRRPSVNLRKASRRRPSVNPRRPSPRRPSVNRRKASRRRPSVNPRRPSRRRPSVNPRRASPRPRERQPEKGQPKATERQPDGNQKSTQQDTRHNSRVQVSEQQRGGVRERLFKEGKFGTRRSSISM